jgi:hypothetical protein
VATDSGQLHKRVECCRAVNSVYSSASIRVDDAIESDCIRASIKSATRMDSTGCRAAAPLCCTPLPGNHADDFIGLYFVNTQQTGVIVEHTYTGIVAMKDVILPLSR